MEQLKAYYQRFFGSKNKGGAKEQFVTRLGSDWKTHFPALSGLEVFALRLTKAVLLDQKIAIFSDYDTDAVCASSVLYWGLMELGISKDNVVIYAPDRFSESYGLNLPAIKKLAASNDLIITVDCGINSLEEAEFLQDEHCDLLITDHHQIKEGLPSALSVINPQVIPYLAKKPSKQWQKNQSRQEEKLIMSLRNYTTPESYEQFIHTVRPSGRVVTTSLVGASVIWYCLVYTAYYWSELVEAGVLRLTKEQKKQLSDFTPKRLEKLLSFVAVATIADCQSIVDPLNRLLVQAGLKYLNTTVPYPGLTELLAQTGFATKIDSGYRLNSQDIGFTLSPILNAAGRIAHAKHALDAMISWKPSEAKKLVAGLIDFNTTRKAMVAKAMISVQEELSKNSSKTVVISGDWNKGIVGLIASRVVHQSGGVTVVLSSDGDIWSGSARAPEGYDLVSLFGQVSELLETYGGHAGAAGLKIKPSKVKEFTKQLTEAVSKTKIKRSAFNVFSAEELATLPEVLRVYGQIPQMLYLSSKLLTASTIEGVWTMDPFGQDFPLPLILSEISGYTLRTFGSESQHAKIVTESGLTLNYFGIPEDIYKKLYNKETVWMTIKPSINAFRGIVSYEGTVEKIL